MIYVVLGMHKSGTTLVSQTLHQSGISMGPEFDEAVTYDQGNQWERETSWRINLDLVGAREADYYSLNWFRRVDAEPPTPLAERMHALCRDAASEADDWGFKDPLTCLTWSPWARILPEPRIVAVYRSPGEVMNHYRCGRFDGLRAWQVVRAWSHYNLGLLDAVEAAGDRAIGLRYDALMNDEAEYDRLREFVGRPLVDVRKPGQYRARRAHPLFGPVSALMARTTGVDPNAVWERLEAMRPAGR